MEAVRLWIRQICAFLVISAILKNLLPKERYGPYVRLFVNLLMVLMLVRPLLKISEESVSVKWSQAAAFTDEGRYLEADLRAINDKYTDIEEKEAGEILYAEIGVLLKDKGFELIRIENIGQDESGKISVRLVIKSIDDEYKGIREGEEINSDNSLEIKNYIEDYFGGRVGAELEFEEW